MAANNNTASVVDSRNDIPLDTATINASEVTEGGIEMRLLLLLLLLLLLNHHHHHHHHHFFNNMLTKCNNEQNIRKLITVFKK